MPKVGDVLQFSLPDGQYAYGRMLRDSSVSFYTERSQTPNLPPIGSTSFDFTVGVYNKVLRSDEVPVVGHDERNNEYDDWAPPEAIYHMRGTFSIYEYGEIKPSSKELVDGLERAAVWDYGHIIDRLMGDDKWMPR